MDLRSLLNKIDATLVDDYQAEGWKTSRELQSEWGLKRARANEILRKAVDAGLVEVKTANIRCKNGTQPLPVYREKK
jgi:predicted transcriptional regulator